MNSNARIIALNADKQKLVTKTKNGKTLKKLKIPHTKKLYMNFVGPILSDMSDDHLNPANGGKPSRTNYKIN